MAGAEAGEAMADAGGILSELGSVLEGYVEGGVIGAVVAGVDARAMAISSATLSEVLAPGKLAGLSGPARSATAAILASLPDALKKEEEACGN